MAMVWVTWATQVYSNALPANVQFQGFASQGIVYSRVNRFFTDAVDKAGLDFTEVGINGSMLPHPSMRIAAQILARRAGETDDGHIRLDYGLLDFRLRSVDRYDLGIRVGRLKNPLGLYNETRDMAFTRPCVLLPQSIYFDRVRDIALSGDGLHVYSNHRWAHNNIYVQLGAILPRVGGTTTESALLMGNRPGKLQRELTYLGRIIYEYNGGRVRVAYSDFLVNTGYREGSGGSNGDGDIRFNPKILSLQFNAETFSMTAEYARRNFKFHALENYLPFDEVTGESFYLQSTFRPTAAVELMLRYDVVHQDGDDKNGKQFQALTGIPGYFRYAKDWTLGGRWLSSQNWLISLEQHWVEGTAWLPPQDNPNINAIKKNWGMTLFTVTYRFF